MKKDKACYVTNPFSGHELPNELTKENTLFYPETGMTTHDCLNSGRPLDFHIVTDCHFLVSLYDNSDVFIWEDGKWVNPTFQTYGTSYNLILSRLWDNRSNIPQAVINGKITNIMGFNLDKSK